MVWRNDITLDRDKRSQSSYLECRVISFSCECISFSGRLRISPLLGSYLSAAKCFQEAAARLPRGFPQPFLARVSRPGEATPQYRPAPPHQDRPHTPEHLANHFTAINKKYSLHSGKELELLWRWWRCCCGLSEPPRPATPRQTV